MASKNKRHFFWGRPNFFLPPVFGPIRSPGQEPDNSKTAISPLRNNDFCRIGRARALFFHVQNEMISDMKKKRDPSPAEGPSIGSTGSVYGLRGPWREGFREGTPPYMNMQGLDMNMDRV